MHKTIHSFSSVEPRVEQPSTLGYDQFIEKASFSMNLLKHIDSGDESGCTAH